MDKAQLTEFVKSLDSELTVVDGKQFVEVTVPASKLHEVALALRNNENAKFDYLFCLTGVDYKQDLGVVYHMRSTLFNHTLVLKVRISDRINPHFESVADVWKTAEYHEREVFDLMGIRFDNHPDLRRFFLEKSFGYPLRKDFSDDVNIVTK